MSEAIDAQPRATYYVNGRPGLNDRPPLPAGHPASWGALKRLTPSSLTNYPYPLYQKPWRKEGCED